MAWTVVRTRTPIVHVTNDEGNVAEAFYDERQLPTPWTIRFRNLTGAPESHADVVAMLDNLNQ